MSYTVETLIERFRDQMDDNELPYFWSEDRICELLDEAQREFAIQTGIFKGSTPVAVTTADPYVDIPDETIHVRRALLQGQNRPLSILNMADLDSAWLGDDYGNSGGVSDWETITGTPKVFIIDETTNKGRLSPIPIADGTITLHYTRFPTKSITASSAKPELIDPRHQRSLILYARALAYDDHDVDTYNPARAMEFYAKFRARLEEFSGEITRRQERPRVVRYGGL